MKKFYFLLLCCLAIGLLIGLAGCSTEQPKSVNGPAMTGTEGSVPDADIVVNAGDAVLTESPDETRQEVSVICCLSPILQCISVTDTTITFRICTQSTGAPNGLRIQWAAVPAGLTCATFPFPTSNVLTVNISGAVAPYACRTITIRGLECGTIYALRGFTINQFNCPSPPSARLCCTTNACAETLPCFPMPTFNCLPETSFPPGFLGVQVCMPPPAPGVPLAPTVVLVQYQPLLPGMACNNVVWPGPAFTFATVPLPPGGCFVQIFQPLPPLPCGTTFAFRVQAQPVGPFCASPWIPTVCCVSAPCPAGPPLPPPTVTCLVATDTSLTVEFCTGALGAPGGMRVEYATVPFGTGCAEFVWPDNPLFITTPPNPTPGTCFQQTFLGLDCNTAYVFRAQALASLPFGASATVQACCTTATCEAGACLNIPTLTCLDPTESTLALQLCPGGSGAPGGFTLQYAPLPAGMACASFVWTGPGVVTVPGITAFPSNACRDLTLPGLICGQTYALRVRANAYNELCESDYSNTYCCTVAECPPPTCVDRPTVSCDGITDTSLTWVVCAGASGAPAGVQVQYVLVPPGTTCANFAWPATGVTTVMTNPLTANTCYNVSVNHLLCGRTYAVRVRALTAAPFTCPSEYTTILCCNTHACPATLPGCTHTVTYWRTYPNLWPVTTLQVGAVSYSQIQLITALSRSTNNGANALVVLVKQVIAAKLNIAAGASPTPVTALLTQADLLIGATSITSGSVLSSTALGQQMIALANQLEQYNAGLLGVVACN